MSEKINYHLSNIFSELKSLISEEISTSIYQSLNKNSITNTTEPYLTIDQLAKSLNISKSHINKLREKHSDFPTLRMDSSIRFKLSEVETFFKNNAINAK